MKINFEDPYIKLCTLKAVEKYGTTANLEANKVILAKFDKINWKKKHIDAIQKAFSVNFDKNDITMNLAAAMAALELLKSDKKRR